MGSLKGDVSARVAARVVVVGGVLGALGCGPKVAPSSFWGTLAVPQKMVAVSLRQVSATEWKTARTRLALMQAEVAASAYVERVHIAIVEPNTHTRYEARGGLAVQPGRAVRMMLVGPGGATALDLWLTAERSRFSVPAASLEGRGQRPHDEAQGLPMGFFRWWLLAPLRGRLLDAHVSGADTSWLLKDGDATVMMRRHADTLVLLRRAGGRDEALVWQSRSMGPEAGARGQYRDGRYGLHVDVEVEAVADEPPPDEAFDEPRGPSSP